MRMTSAIAPTPDTASAPAGPDSEPIRVAFVVHVMQVAGAEVLIRALVDELHGWIAPTIFCLDQVGRIGEELRDRGVPVLSFGRRPGRDLRVSWRMAQEIRRRRIELLHAHQYTPFFYSALARLTAGTRVRLVFTEHGRHFPDTVSPLRRTLNRVFLARLADDVNAVCAFSGQSLATIDGFSRRPIGIIENGIAIAADETPANRSALRARLGLDPDRRYVATVARFHPVKDHATLVRAFQVVARRHSDVDLLLAGDGPLRAETESLADALGVADRIRFLGVRSDVPELLRAADVFALASVSEAASLTLLEAMAAGLPVVVTNVGGNPEIVRQGVEGWLVPRGDASAVAAAIGKVLDDPEHAATLGAAGRARVLDRYRLESTVEAYHRLYRKLCRAGGPS